MKKISFLSLSIAMIVLTTVFNSCKKDPCLNTTCLNGGTCANGQCNCPSGWSGSDCSVQVTPTKIKITKIELLKFPPTTTSGGGWDLTDGPDLFVKVLKGTTTLWENPTYYQNASQGIPYSFTPSNPIEITSPKDEYIIQLWDFDTLDPNDLIGGIKFTPYYDTNKFPATLTLECTTCTTSYRLYFQYVF